MTDPVFHIGQKITPVYTNGYDGTKDEAIKALRYAIERLEK